jgi:hypothetical protein
MSDREPPAMVWGVHVPLRMPATPPKIGWLQWPRRSWRSRRAVSKNERALSRSNQGEEPMSNEPMTQQEQDALRAALAELEGDQPTQRGRFRALRRGTRSWTGPALFRNAGAREDKRPQRLCSLHNFQGIPIEGRYHRSQVTILDDVCVRTLVWLREERRRNNPLSGEYVPNLNAVLGRESNAFQPSFLRIFAEPGEHFARRLATFHDLAAGQIHLEIVWILREEPIPIAMIERIQMLCEDRLLGWLFFERRECFL